jgi:NADPH-dependent 7-cyano-7-deazaguanine reductase QueF
MRDNSTLMNETASVGTLNEDSRNIDNAGELMSKTVKFKKLCNGKDIQIVDNKTFMSSLHQMKCMPGFQTVKAKYAPDTKAFFESKTNLEIMTKFKNVEFP